MNGKASFQGLEIELHRHPGVRVLRVVHPHAQDIDEHRHDWAYIGLHTLGAYREIYDGGEADMAGPCAVLHPPGRPHADVIGDRGLETLTVEFDTAWLKLHGFDGRLDRSQIWRGGKAALAGRQLAWLASRKDATEREIGEATIAFVRAALGAEEPVRPRWLERVEYALAVPRPAKACTTPRDDCASSGHARFCARRPGHCRTSRLPPAFATRAT